MRYVLVLILALLVAACDSAQSQTRSVTASWVNPTQYVDGSALPSTQIARTCIAVSLTENGAAVGAETCLNGAGTTVQVPVPDAPACGTFWFTAVTVTTNGQRSAPSNAASRTFACAPRSPTALTVT